MGLFAYVAALPEGASTTLETLAKLKAEGKEAITKARRELEDAGFLRVIEDRHQGRFASSTWMLAVTPHDFDGLLPGSDGEIIDPPPAARKKPKPVSPATDAPQTALPLPGLPSPVESTHIKNDLLKTEDHNNEKETPKASGIPSDIAELVEAWNKFAEAHAADGIAPIVRLSQGKRLQMMRTRMKDPWWREHYEKALAQIPKQRWRMGLNDRNWKANPEWFCRPDTVDKLIEESKASGGTAPMDARNRSLVRPTDRMPR